MGDAEVTASNWRMVEVGRVVLFSIGPHTGRIAVICQIIDHKRVLVDCPTSKPELKVPRHAAPLSSVTLTNILVEKLPRGAGTLAVQKKWEESEIDSKWEKSGYAKRMLQASRRKQLNDFERFKVMRLRKQARFEVRKAVAQAKASA